MSDQLILGPNGRLLLVGGHPLISAATASPSGGTLSLALTDFYVGNSLAHPVFQRKSGTDYADVPVLASYTGTAPSGIQARVVNIDSKAVIKDWAPLTSLQVNATNQTIFGYLPAVPIGADYQLQTRDGNQPANAATTSSGTRRWGVGVCIILAGQSNMLGTLTAGSFDSPIPGTTTNEGNYWKDPAFPGVYFGIDGFGVPWIASPNGAPGGGAGTIIPGWDSGGGGGGGFIRMVAAGLAAKYGRRIPVCAAPWAFGGTGLPSMFPPGDSGTDSSGKAKIYTASGTTAGNIGWKSPAGYGPGDFEGILLHQGEAESGAILRPARLQQLKDFYNFMLGLVAPFGRTASDLFFRPAVLGVYTDGGTKNVEHVRGAVYDLEAYAQANGWPRVKAGWTCIDLDTNDPLDTTKDGLHFHDVSGGNPYKKWSLRRAIQTAMKELGCSAFSGMGPKISSASRSGNVATVTVTHEGGSTLVARNSGGALTGWYANTAADFSGADIAVTATIASASTVAVTFPDGTVFPVYLKYLGGKVGTSQSMHPDVSNPVYDNAVYPVGVHPGDQFTGLPLQPTPDAIVVN